MKILIINSRYFLSAGPEKYMFGLIDLLSSHGHEVVPFSTRNSKNVDTKYKDYFVEPIGGDDLVYFNEYKKDFKTISQIIGRQFYSFYVRSKLDKLIKDLKPDISYILHHYNKLSPSIIDACKSNDLPVVMRLSDFFMVCPEGHLYRNNSVCEECIHHSLFRSVKHKCVKGSFFGSLLKASAMFFHRLIKVYSKVDYIISPSLFTIDKVSHLIDPNKLRHIPTFTLHKERYNPSLGKYILYVGRIEEQKGLLYAIKAVESTHYTLKIVGDSSSGYSDYLKEYVDSNKIKNVEFLGKKVGDELADLYKGARVVVIPAVWYENLPNVFLEAMSYSRPILASNIGSLKEIIKDRHNGILFEPKNVVQLKEKIDMLYSDSSLCRKLGKNAYTELNLSYNPEVHYERLIKVFEQVIKEKVIKLR